MKIICERNRCIGCGTCTMLCPKDWEMGDDSKTQLKGSSVNPKNGNLEKEVEKIGCSQEAADSCPVQCIIIEK